MNFMSKARFLVLCIPLVTCAAGSPSCEGVLGASYAQQCLDLAPAKISVQLLRTVPAIVSPRAAPSSHVTVVKIHASYTAAPGTRILLIPGKLVAVIVMKIHVASGTLDQTTAKRKKMIGRNLPMPMETRLRTREIERSTRPQC